MVHQPWHVKIFNIKKDEAKPTLLLMIFSFFIGLSLSFYFTASNAIFLKHFTSRMIPLSYVASGVIVYTAWWILSHLDRKLSLPRQLIIKLFFVFITVSTISIGVWVFDTPVLAFIMFTWFRVLVFITLVTFWGLAGKLFDIRQGKRIFGLIGIGEVISTIIGYFSIPLLLHFFKTPDLLFLASGSLLLCLVVVFIILRTFPDQLAAARPAGNRAAIKVRSEWNYWNLLKKPYFLLISLMALLPIFSYLFVIFLFLAQTKTEFANNPEAVARFVGIFLGFVAILELILKLFSGRFLNKFGLKPSLLSLPIILLLSISLAAIFGSLYGPVGMFFAFIALAWLFDRSIRSAVYEPSFQLLYQPVPNDQRLAFQNQIEGIPKALGIVITGAVILLFSTIHSFSLVHYSWVFAIVLIFWIWIAFKMYEEYRNMLKSKLSEIKTDETDEQDPMVSLIRQIISKAAPDKIQKVVDFFETVEPASLKKARDNFMADSVSPGNKTAEEEYTFEQMVDMARSDLAEERLWAAHHLGTSGRYNTYKLLINLIKDPDPGVRRAAIISSGKIRRVELWPFIIENLIIPEYSHAAGIALRIIGEPILQDLDRFFEKINAHKQIQLKIIQIFEAIRGEKSIKFLREKMYHPDSDIRFQVLISLSNLEYHATVTEIAFIKQIIEDSVESMVWVMASLSDLSEYNEGLSLREALLLEMEEKKEQIFLLLSLLYESKTIRHIRENIESPDTNAKIYALEISEMTISDDIKELFFPIFEDLSITERLNRLSLRFPQEKMNLIDRLEEIINMNYSKISKWTKACAIDTLSETDTKDSGKIELLLSANIVNPDPLLAELAVWILYTKFRTYYIDTIILFEKREMSALSRILRKIKLKEKNADLLIYEKVGLLKTTEFFAPVHESQILNLVVSLGEPDSSTSSDIKPLRLANTEAITVTSDGGHVFSIPYDKIFEMMTGNAVMTERFLHLIFNNNNA